MTAVQTPGRGGGAIRRGRSALEDRRYAHTARRADRNQPATVAAPGELLGERRNDTRAGGGKRMPDGEAAAVDVEFRAIDRPERSVEAELVTGELGRLPRLERAQDLRGEGLVDLVEIEVREREPRISEHPWDAVSGRHEEPLAVDEIDGRHLAVGEPRLHRQTASTRPLLAGEQ